MSTRRARLLEGDMLADRIGSDLEFDNALDLGCGIRSPLSDHRDRLRLFGLDSSPEVVEKARRLGKYDKVVYVYLTRFDPG